ncbi:MAG TPA: hypothetical protein VF756_22285 [Thermoanaerobaculia bacterium]
MQGSDEDTIPSVPSVPSLRNAFHPEFLKRLGERDEPVTAGEADVAGPWLVEEIPGHGWGLYRAGESLARGFRPTAVFPDHDLARLAAAVLPGTGRDRLFRLATEQDADGYEVVLDGGEAVGRLRLFDEALVDALNVAVSLVRSPQSLAYLLEAAGSLALERCGALLDRRVFDPDPEAA